MGSHQRAGHGGVDDKMTRVDGKGLWRSWKRNFKTKLLALLDLIDNSLDAAVQGQDGSGGHEYVGRVHVYPDAIGGYRDPSSTTTGLCIVNNCVKSIRPLEKVLEVYNSSKVHSGAGDIGENGVGLKQGCATLSDLSFVLVKNGSDANIELGFCAESLQREKGCYLPAFKLSNYGSESLKDQMNILFGNPKHADVANCVAQYGGGSLSAGIERLCRHFDHICFNFYGNARVFMIVLDKLHHGQTEDYVRDNARDSQQRVTVDHLMRELTQELPRTYLHVPDNFDFTIGNTRAAFKYWPARLVELAEFTVNVNSKIPWQQKFDLDDHPDTYGLRVLIGFDGLRITDSAQGREGSLYVYSRQSGRLISHQPDARTDLGLTAGGTAFCQGLTVLIDDYRGNLPLNPTKQAVAFGEESHGATHQRNLLAWVGSVAHFYYQYHLSKFHDKKTVLTQKVAAYGDVLLQKHRRLKTLDSSDMTTYNVSFRSVGKSIRADKSSAREIVGPDTLYRLKPEKSRASVASKDKKRKAASSASAANSMKVPRRKQPVSYREAESSSEGEADDSSSGSEHDSGKPKAAAKSIVKHESESGDSEESSDNGGEATNPTDAAQGQRKDPHTKEFYRSLCDRLTIKTKEKKKEIKKQKKEIVSLKEELEEMKDQLEKERDMVMLLRSTLKKNSKQSNGGGMPAKNGHKKAVPKKGPSKNGHKKASMSPNGKSGDLSPCPDIGVGWTKKVVPRINGSQNDLYYFSPTGKKFRSLAAAKRHHEEGGE